MLTAILAFFQAIPAITGGFNNFVSKYYDAKVQITMSQMQCDRDQAIAHLNALVQMDANRVSFLQTVAHSPALMLIVAGFAFPFIVYINKVVIWDICLGWGSTPSIRDANIIEWGKAILYGIFGTSGAMVAGSVIKAAVFSSKS